MQKHLFKIIIPIILAKIYIGIVSEASGELSIIAYIGAGISGGILGLIIGAIIDYFRKPSKVKVIINHKNLNNNSKVRVADELFKINELRKENAITEEEFQKVKAEILNRK